MITSTNESENGEIQAEFYSELGKTPRRKKLSDEILLRVDAAARWARESGKSAFLGLGASTVKVVHAVSTFIADSTSPPATVKPRDWSHSTGRVRGKKGETKNIIFSPQCLFRVEKMMAHDFRVAMLPQRFEPVMPGVMPVAKLEDAIDRVLQKPSIVETVSPGDGTLTRISCVLIGQRLQMPAGTSGILTACFAPNVMGNGWEWDACLPALSIAISVQFLEDAEWEATLFGTAVL